jgi:hypothetical protein
MIKMRVLKKKIKRFLYETMEIPVELSPLFEMAIDRVSYCNKIRSQLRQILENFCLIEYVEQSKDKQELQNHWKSELAGILVSLGGEELKGGNKKKTKLKAIWKEFEEPDYDKNQKKIQRVVMNKFFKEQISVKNEMFLKIANNFIKALPMIVDLIADGNEEETRKTIRAWKFFEK